VEHVRSYYRRDDLSGALALGQLESLALPFDHHTLAFTPGLVAAVYGTRVDDSSFAINGGYVHSEGEPSWWSPAGRVFYSPGAGDTVADELSHARKHFFLTHRYRDPFHTNAVSTERFSSYDEHDLLLIETHDVLGNLTRATGNYRTLLPQAVTDMNGNRSAAAFDALGLVVGTAVMGKSTESLGDSFAGFEPDLVEAMVLDHLQDPFTNPHDLLRKATSRLVYDAHAYYRTRNATAPQPVVLYSLVRETHDSELPSPQLTAIQHAFHYSDGFGRAIQTKIQAESGAVPTRDATGRIILDADHLPVMSTSPALHRWVGTGWTVFDNKAQPVRQYEPFFSDTQHFESDVRIGVSPVVLYDPLARPLATLHPDHSWEKVLSTPWRRESWDVNDTLLLDPSMDPDVAAWFQRLPAADYLPTWHAQRIGGALGVEEKEAAEKAAVHAATPTIAHLDSRGRVCVTVAKNRYLENDAPVDEDLVTRVDLDIDGNELAVVDAAARVVARYDYDVAATRIHESSMDAGERWLLNDATGNALYAWDSRNHQLRNIYDALRRRIESRLTDGMNPESVVLRTVYGENQPNAESQNLRGKVFQSFDQAGLVTSERYDFKGNLLTTRRQFVGNYKTTVDWLASPALEAEVFTTTSTYDAINRVRTVTTPDSSVFTPSFNEANLLERIDIKVRGAAVASPFVTNIDRDAKGHRSKIEYANGTRTEYSYDRKTFLLRRLHTIRTADNAPLQDFNYTYDPAGNITHIRDDSQQTIYYNNQAALPESDYTYDAIYRLIASEGREHIGQAGQPQTSWNDEFRIGLPHPGDGTAMRRYSEAYELDAAGNLVRVRHQANGGNWTRAYHYNEPSLIDAASMGNRLSSTQVGANLPEAYTYDAHGNVSSMPHLTLMQWDFADRLQATARQVVNAGSPETTYYVYDSSGARVRKVTERQNGTRKSERLSIGSFERYSDYDATGAQATLSRESLQVMDDHQRVAIIETRVTGNDGSPPQLTRYQLANHQGSVALELDSAAAIISYEEYYAYGSTSYQARGLPGAAAKRYRYAGMERDEESGFAHHGARYYAPWLARWTSADPIGIDGGLNLYEYASDRPTALVDPEGTQPKRQLWLAEWGKFKITPAATRTGRGISKPQRAALRGLNDAFGPGPRNQKMHWGHPANQTHGTTPAGQRPPLKPQLAGENMSQGATVDKATKARAKQQGQFTRDAKGVDRTAPKGKKYNGSGPPDDPFVKEMADYEKSIAKRKPPKTTPRADPPPSRAPVHEQLELPLEKPAVPAPKPAAPEPKPTGSRSGLGGKIVGYAGAAGLVGDALVQLHEGHPGEAAKNVGIAGGVGFVVSKVPALAPLAIMAGTISAYDDDVKEHANSAGSWVEDHTGSRTLGAVSASVEATGESVFQGTFGTVGRGIGQGAAVLYIRATSDDYTIIPWKTQIWSDIFD
jgi:RHS repeat-associated protein